MSRLLPRATKFDKLICIASTVYGSTPDVIRAKCESGLITKSDIDEALFLFAIQLQEPKVILEHLNEERVERNKDITAHVMMLVVAKRKAKDEGKDDEVLNLSRKIKDLTGCR